jgi:uncharacterized protein YbaR (Trm112 family)
MYVLPVSELLCFLVCPACFTGRLSMGEDRENPSVACTKCGRDFPRNDSFIDFVMDDHLDETSQRERRFFDVSDEAAVFSTTQKDNWNSLYIGQATHNIDAIVELIRPGDQGRVLCSIGSGAGFELKLLLKRCPFDKVLSSDISPRLPVAVPATLSEFSGKLGVFASEFEHCPVAKEQPTLGLVYQALHHSSDAHRSLVKLLDQNFDELIIVEPVTNWLVEILSLVGLAKRREYSGLDPDWMRISRIRQIGNERGYYMQTRIWWELPPLIAGNAALEKRPTIARAIVQSVRLLSWLTGFVGLGSMAAIRLSKTSTS